MKKLLYALGLAAPLLATPVSATEVSDFFANEPTTHKIVRYYDDDGGGRARVKGELDDVILVIVFKIEGKLNDAGWNYDDNALKAIALKIGNVDVGREDFIRLKGIYGDPIDYIPLPDTEELQGDLTPGETVAVKAVKNFLRPDKTTYSILGETLHRLSLDETQEVVGGEFKTLVRAWGEIKCHGFKSKKGTRHLIQNYSQKKVTQIIKKLHSIVDKEIDEPTIVEFIALTKTGTYESWDNEAGRSSVPNGYKVVG